LKYVEQTARLQTKSTALYTKIFFIMMYLMKTHETAANLK